MEYIKRMIDVRKDNDQTQTELAKALGWSRIQIARYETNKSIPNIEYLITFCNYYKISSDYLLGLPKNLEWPRG